MVPIKVVLRTTHALRFPLVVLFNIALTVISYGLALALRFDFDPNAAFPPDYIGLPVLILVTARLVTYLRWDLLRGYWRYVSTHDLVRIGKAHLTSSLVFTAAVMFLRIPGYPRSVIIIEFMLSILFAGGSRLLVRLFCERFLIDNPRRSTGPTREVIVLGAGDSGNLVIKNLLSHSRFGYTPVAVLDDSERLWGSAVQGIPVVGPLHNLNVALNDFPGVSAVIVAIPSLSATRFNEIKRICDAQSLLVKRVQAFEDLALFDPSDADSFTIESLLEKEVEIEHEEEIKNAIRDKVVLITGAGGSIGSELVRQVIHFHPKKVILFDHSEYNLFQINREITEKYPYIEKEAILATVCDAARLACVFTKHSPEFVFHAAAYKHVPLMEVNPYEAFKNNVIGTKNVLDACHQFGVKRFVLISTDKAVDPSSVMGCSKRIAELLLQEYATHNPNGVSLAAVRFGNVINSAGSVVPLFKDQILSGGPITVTHPEMERYFMSIREAVRLVLTAGTLGEHGEIYVLDMGEPVKIVDVAQKMLALYGRKDISIVFTGVRAGEKLSERLSDDSEASRPSRFKKVNKVTSKVQGISVAAWTQSHQGLPPTSDFATELKDFVQKARESLKGKAAGNRVVPIRA